MRRALVNWLSDGTNAPRPRRVFHGLAVGLVAMTLSGQALAVPRYDVTEIAVDAVPRGINNSAQVVGRGPNGPFIWSESSGLQTIPLPSAAPHITFTGAGAATDINEQGNVSGDFFALIEDTSGQTNFGFVPFRWKASAGSELLTPAASPSDYSFGQARAINNQDQVVGLVNRPTSIGGGQPDDAKTFPVLWDSTGPLILGESSGFPPVHDFGTATDILETPSTAGVYPVLMYHNREVSGVQITETLGYYWDATASPIDRTNKDEIYSGNAWPPAQTQETRVEAMNESLQIVGTGRLWTTPPHSQVGGFLYDLPSDTFTTIPFLPGGTFVDPAGINEAGLVVGYAIDAIDQQHAFLWSLLDGLLLLDDLVDPTLGLKFERAMGINDLGQIIAFTGPRLGLPGSVQTAYLLTPRVPEPSAVALLMLGGLSLVGVRRSRRSGASKAAGKPQKR